MKVTIFAVFALVSSAFATPLVAERQLESQANQLDSLLTRIQGYTAAINKTVDAAPSNPSLDQQNTAAAKLAPQLQGLTDALNDATKTLSKREVWAATGACDKDCILVKVKGIVYELVCTIKGILLKLGLGCVLVYLSPLILALVGLLKCLDRVVDGLLIAVKHIVDDLLRGIGGALLGLLL